MSATAVQDFLAKVSEDKELQGEVAKAMETDNDREAVTVLAQSKGYEFTTDELGQEIQARQAELQRRQAAGELSDEELEAVAGGATPSVVAVTYTSVLLTISAGVVIGSTAKW